MVKKKWVSTDGWRGYYDIVPTENEAKAGWKQATHFNIVPHEQNQEFFNASKQALGKRFNVRILTAPTSNVFSVNKVVFLKPKGRSVWTKEDKEIAKKFDNEFSETYGEAFSIMSGTTSPIDIDSYKRKLDEIVSRRTKSKLERVSA